MVFYQSNHYNNWIIKFWLFFLSVKSCTVIDWSVSYQFLIFSWFRRWFMGYLLISLFFLILSLIKFYICKICYKNCWSSILDFQLFNKIIVKFKNVKVRLGSEQKPKTSRRHEWEDIEKPRILVSSEWEHNHHSRRRCWNISHPSRCFQSISHAGR
jgi:hypothetical protein